MKGTGLKIFSKKKEKDEKPPVENWFYNFPTLFSKGNNFLQCKMTKTLLKINKMCSVYVNR